MVYVLYNRVEGFSTYFDFWKATHFCRSGIFLGVKFQKIYNNLAQHTVEYVTFIISKSLHPIVHVVRVVHVLGVEHLYIIHVLQYICTCSTCIFMFSCLLMFNLYNRCTFKNYNYYRQKECLNTCLQWIIVKNFSCYSTLFPFVSSYIQPCLTLDAIVQIFGFIQVICLKQI